MAPALGPIDWGRPWLEPWRAIGASVAAGVASGLSLPDALNVVPDCPVRFVSQSHLPPGASYEDFIHSTGCCPTRNGLHDFFNGLCWIRFPQTKRALNRLQAAQIAAGHVGPVRGAVRDALTVFDENAAFLQAPEPLWAALQAKDWRRLFLGLRPQWQQARLLLFGHALLEKLASPRKAITAHVYRVAQSPQSVAELDRWVADDLNPESLARKPFAPLPVLGVPAWWPANEEAAFYADTAVFRPVKPGHASNTAARSRTD